MAKKTALLQPDFFIGMLFGVVGVVVPNAPIRRKVRGGKKLKPHAVGFALVESIFVLFICLCQGCTKVS